MKKKVTVVVCDICEREFDTGTYEGVVHLDSRESLRFDICEDDKQKLFGKIEPSARRGRKGQAEELVA